MAAGFKLAVLTVDGTIEVQLPCNLDDDMNIVIENKGVPYPEGRGIHHVISATYCLLDVPVVAALTCDQRSESLEVDSG